MMKTTDFARKEYVIRKRELVRAKRKVNDKRFYDMIDDKKKIQTMKQVR